MNFFEQFGAAARDGMQKYEAITPPPHLQALHDRVISVLRDEASALDESAEPAREFIACRGEIAEKFRHAR